MTAIQTSKDQSFSTNQNAGFFEGNSGCVVTTHQKSKGHLKRKDNALAKCHAIVRQYSVSSRPDSEIPKIIKLNLHYRDFEQEETDTLD